ncbi:MAG: DUF819 family protein [Planctomycetes bacterium]|nr:DUF819 family protein [Planctomycetota bacterium]
MAVTAFLLGILGVLFAVAAHPRGRRLFKFVPFLVFAYFVPTLFSNSGVIPLESPAYGFIKSWFLPASLLLLTLSVDIPAVMRLGLPALLLFATATLSIVIGGPLAYLALHGILPAELGEEAWKGLAALSGSWIGGTANMLVIGNQVGVADSTFQLMIVVDVAVANVWMAVLLWFAGRDRQLDERIGADRSSLEACRRQVENYQAEVSRPATLADLMRIVALAICGTALARALAQYLPTGEFITGFTWIVLIVTAMGVGLSFTPLRHLEGAGASKMGSVFLYLLVASIGAHADFLKIKDAPALVLIGALWMAIHAGVLLLVRRLIRAPIFFVAVGSKANIGGAASAPIVAAAFHPALSPVGILLAVVGYVVGTPAGIACAWLLRLAHGLVAS